MEWLNTLTAFYLLSAGMDVDGGVKGWDRELLTGWEVSSKDVSSWQRLI